MMTMGTANLAYICCPFCFVKFLCDYYLKDLEKESIITVPLVIDSGWQIIIPVKCMQLMVSKIVANIITED